MHENPVVIVTGASRGLGASVAHWLALHAPRDFSGDFLGYDDTRISKPSRLVLGEYSVSPHSRGIR